MNQRIEIIVDSKGNSKVETKGFSGSKCIQASKLILQALGKQIAMQTTPEFFQTANQSQQASNNNGPS